MVKRKANPDRNVCVACGVCVGQCPRGAISIHRGCYAVVDNSSCVGCGLCEKVCPANAINIEEVKENKNVVK